MKNKAIFITGTDTGVGKTVVCAGLAVAFRKKGINAGVMKPIATGARKIRDKFVSCDVKFLKKATGVNDETSLVNPYCIDLPLAPYVAFKLRKKIISVKKIKNCFSELLMRHQLLLIEGVGGLAVPIRQDYLVINLIKDLAIPLIIVSRNGLGTINHTLLTIKQAQDFGIDILGVIFNSTNQGQEDISKKTNLEIIEKISKVSILGELPYLKSIDVEKGKIVDLAKAVEKNINLDLIIRKIKNSNQKYSYNRLAALDKKYVWHPFTQMRDWQSEEPLIIEEGRGAYLKDVQGRWFLDGVSSLWVNIHGHQKKEVDEAIKKQLSKVAHSTLLGLANVPSIKLAEQLIKISPKNLKKVFYSDNGSTSVEIALKMAFQFWQHKNKRQKTQFVYLDNSYHGDTIGSVSVGGVDSFHKIFHPLLFRSFKVDSPYCYRCPLTRISANPCLTARQATRINANKKYPNCKLACLKKLENILKNHHNNIAALIIEPIVQCAGGMIVWPRGILKKMRELCTKYNVLLIADEVAVGFGRTGKMFACEHEGISPDILCLAKGLSAGYLPLAATLTTDKIYNAFLADYKDRKTFFHGHSYTGNPLACQAALASLEIFRKERTLDKLQPKVEFLRKELLRFRELAQVGDIRQKGLIVGIELVKNKNTRGPYHWQDRIGLKVCRQVRKYGVILRPLGNVIVLMPPLSVSRGQLKEILDITYGAIKFVTEE